jgi:hypothetical protein
MMQQLPVTAFLVVSHDDQDRPNRRWYPAKDCAHQKNAQDALKWMTAQKQRDGWQ